jgi:N-acetylmuramoyl-L-alanine amidase
LAHGCATIPPTVSREPIELGDFCAAQKCTYAYVPFTEEIKVESRRATVILKVGFSVASVGGSVRRLSGPVTYSDGKIFVPSDFADVYAAVRTSVSLRPLIGARRGAFIKTIVIDAGHGGKDPGTMSARGIKEKNINLATARALRDMLVSSGYRVYMTRDRDVFIPLEGRVQYAKMKQADLFVSVHTNANRSSSLRGLEVYYVKSSQASGQRYRQATMYLSSMVLKASDRLGIATRKAAGAGYFVLRNNVCPSVLVEIGYLSNRSDERLLTTIAYQKQVAAAVAMAVKQTDVYMTRAVRRR